MNGIDDLAKEAGKALQTVPALYDDGLKPTVQGTGKVIALVPQAIYAALKPLRKWIAYQEYNVSETEKLLEQKLQNVKPENIVEPEPYVAVPALQSIAYSMSSDSLRDLYANLLAASMTRDKKWSVHPSYVEIIRQLSPDEAKLLKSFVGKDTTYPLIDINLYQSDDGYNPIVQNFTPIAEGVCEEPANIYAYLDNLSRLKIIDIPLGIFITNDEAYKPLIDYPEIKKLMASSLPDGNTLKIEKHEFEITTFGKKFIDTCVKG